MAVDEAILEGMGRRASLPTLRLYAWEPACLSLGYAQLLTDVDIPRLQSCGWDLVRRSTGGRAVLHTDEITYSIMAPLNEPRMAGSVLESYSRLAEALVEAIRLLGLPVLFLVAAEDKMIDHRATRAIFNGLADKDKTLVEFPGMYHALSIDIGKEAVFQNILNWIEKKL